ncbi:MAG: hypothetical protein OEZ35_04555 [Candidatus Bathyarchaeota archaeon]|nr:hypothetical protein [Candidatus Bathyarchaeota archaeon]
MVSESMLRKIFFALLFLDFLFFSVWAFTTVLLIDVSVQTEYIPTIINGIVSSISIVLGLFGGSILLALIQSRKKLTNSLAIYVVLWLIIATSLLATTYYNLLIESYMLALKVAFIDLLFSLTMLGCTIVLILIAPAK